MAFGRLPIAATLKESSKGVSMDTGKAMDVLSGVLASAGMATSVAFSPAVSAFVPKSFNTQAVTASAGVVGASVAASALVFSSLSPSITNVNFANDITNNNVAVTIDIDHEYALSEVYCIYPDDSRYYAEELGNGKFRIEAGENGDYSVVAVASNGKEETYDFTVDCIDREGPNLGDYTATNDSVKIHFSDNLSEINFDTIQAETVSGQVVEPTEIDMENGSVTFALPEESFVISIEDTLGNVSKSKVNISR